jgi:hypothetical protein
MSQEREEGVKERIIWTGILGLVALIIIGPMLTAVMAAPPTWTPITGNQYNMVAYGDLYVSGIKVNRTDYILGAFGPGGTTDCRAIANPEANGAYYLTILGDVGTIIRITFKVFDPSSGSGGVIYDVMESINFVMDGTQTDFDLHAGDMTAPTVLSLAISPNRAGNVVKAETVAFTITFNENMNQTNSPTVTFGLVPKTITGNYTSATTWVGTYTIATGYDGNQIVSISGANDLSNNTMLLNTDYSFVVDTIIQPTVATTPSATPTNGNYFGANFNVVLTSGDPTATIYYTTNGDTPTMDSTSVVGNVTIPVTVEQLWTIKYFAVDTLGNTEEIKTSTYILDKTPPGIVTGLGVTSLATGVLKLDWTNPTVDFSGVIVVGVTGAAPVLSPVNGVTYTVGQNDVLAAGNVDIFTEVVGRGIHRYYKVFAYDSAMNYSAASSADAVVPFLKKGDMNGDASVNIDDAILGLKINTGLYLPGVSWGYALSGADVNNDGKMGLEEVLYILQCIAGLREEAPTPYTITGEITAWGVALPGATLRLEGEATATTTTDANGRYIFMGLSSGNYTITPSLAGRAFIPKAVTVNNANVTQNFEELPGPPRNLRIVSAGSRVVTLQWDKSIADPYLQSYKVYYYTTPGNAESLNPEDYATAYTLPGGDPIAITAGGPKPITIGKDNTQITLHFQAVKHYYFVITAVDTWGFEGIPTPESSIMKMTVSKAGTGTGAVVGSPSGIDCGTTCSASYPGGTSVTLTATPDAGNTFIGWSGGGCSGTEQCVVTINTAVTVTATFTVDTNDSVSGYWVAYFTPEGSSTLPREKYLQFTQNDSSISYSSPCSSTDPINGNLSGNSFSITTTTGNISGIVNSGSITGSYTDETGIGTWTATKISGAPTPEQCIISMLSVVLIRFQSNFYCIESFIADPTLLVTSASLAGMGNVQGYTYDSAKKRWMDTGTRYCTSSPTFPMSYTVTVNFEDTTSSIVSRSVTVWEWAQ